MQPRTWVWIGALALVGGCPGKSTTTAAGPVAPAELPPVVIESTTSASQAEMAAGFPEDKFMARCAYLSDGSKRFERAVEVNEGGISEYDRDDPERLRIVYRPYHDYMFETAKSVFDKEISGVMVLDDAFYFTLRDEGPDTIRAVVVCTATGDLDRLLQRDQRSHSAELMAYRARVREAKEIAAAGAAAVREVERDAARDERRARLQNLASVRVSGASASDRDDDPEVTIIATLADGTTVKGAWGDPVFDEVFAVNVFEGEAAMMVEVWAKDDTSIRDDGEFRYTFDRERTFECRGEPGKNGTDFDHASGMYYHGRRGDDGPSISIEIAATGHKTAAGEQVLYYRLACDDQRLAFMTGATTRVRVATYGGKGGYAVELPNGDGGNGGNGGDGGNIYVKVDPSVKRWNVKATTKGGDGGAASAAKGATNVNAYGTRGSPGADGTLEETREPVSPP